MTCGKVDDSTFNVRVHEGQFQIKLPVRRLDMAEVEKLKGELRNCSWT